MRHLIILTTGVFLFTTTGLAVAGPFSPAGASRADAGAPIVLVQAKKDETLKAEGQARLAQPRRLQVRR